MWYSKKLVRGTTTAVTLIAATLSPRAAMNGQEPLLPFGWFANVDVPGEYSVHADVSRRPGGAGVISGTIVSSVAEPRQSAFMQQSIRADYYRSKRLRLTGYLKANIDAAQTGLFLRVDGRDYPQIGDLMVGRLIQTTKDWEQYSIVLDVPGDAVGITFGFHLTGAGQAWLDDVSIEIVDRDVPTTVDVDSRAEFGWSRSMSPDGPSPGRAGFDLWKKYRAAPLRPVNLSFEQLKAFAGSPVR